MAIHDSMSLRLGSRLLSILFACGTTVSVRAAEGERIDVLEEIVVTTPDKAL